MKTGLLNPTPLTPDAMGHAPIVDLMDMATGHAESAALLRDFFATRRGA